MRQKKTLIILVLVFAGLLALYAGIRMYRSRRSPLRFILLSE